jgi:hypothetical protein
MPAACGICVCGGNYFRQHLQLLLITVVIQDSLIVVGRPRSTLSGFFAECESGVSETSPKDRYDPSKLLWGAATRDLNLSSLRRRQPRHWL